MLIEAVKDLLSVPVDLFVTDPRVKEGLHAGLDATASLVAAVTGDGRTAARSALGSAKHTANAAGAEGEAWSAASDFTESFVGHAMSGDVVTTAWTFAGTAAGGAAAAGALAPTQDGPAIGRGWRLGVASARLLSVGTGSAPVSTLVRHSTGVAAEAHAVQARVNQAEREHWSTHEARRQSETASMQRSAGYRAGDAALQVWELVPPSIQNS
jgi:hypothetical protein